MKHTEYKVVYMNGNEEIFYCSSIYEAWAVSTHFANSRAWDSRIKYIHDEEHSKTYSNFKLSFVID